MSDTMPEDTGQIEALLADRRRLQEWLARLDAAGETTPARVRQRVRADYDGRLGEIVARLRGFNTTLTASLETLRNHHAEVEAQKAEVEETHAEAQLRHAVGEYQDEEWQRIQEEARVRLEAAAGELAKFGDEITKLEEVLAQIAPDPAPAPGQHGTAPRRLPGDDIDVEVIPAADASLGSRAVDSDDDLVVEPEPEGAADLIQGEAAEAPRAPVEAPRFTPKETAARPRERPAARTLRFPAPPLPQAASPSVDEMTFLKSVTLETPRERAASPLQAPKGGGAGTKTLKCSDCGAMNRATEWYCEKCGAELAAL